MEHPPLQRSLSKRERLAAFFCCGGATAAAPREPKSQQRRPHRRRRSLQAPQKLPSWQSSGGEPCHVSILS
ncbi:hypothetical protein MNEG_9621, partial [Monoraphidium neglectum]